MKLDLQHLAQRISTETGLTFHVDMVVGRAYLLRPAEVSKDHAFSIRVNPDWRRLHISFEPGKFAGDLLSKMGQVDQAGRMAFQTILENCVVLGSEIDFRVNDIPSAVNAEEIWKQRWNRMSLTLSKGQLDFDTGNNAADQEIVCRWTGRFAAAVVAILPVQQDKQLHVDSLQHYPEGAVSTVRVNRYERDRRNRAAAISIHGVECKACGLNFGERYGAIASGFIEVHHITPLSQLGAEYIIDPSRDLVPLCPNCHAVAHRQEPPLSIDKIRMLLHLSKQFSKTDIV